MDDRKRGIVCRFGLESSLKTLEKSTAVLDALVQTIEASGADVEAGNPALGALFLNVAMDLSAPELAARRAFIARYVADGRIANKAQATGGTAFLKALRDAPDAAVDAAAFDKACGAGVRFTDEQIRGRAVEVVSRHAAALNEARYAFPVMDLLREMKEGDWQWADGGKVKAALDAEVLERLGPKTAEDDKKAAEAKKAAASAKAKPAAGKDKKEEPAAAAAGGAGSAAVGGAGAATSAAAVTSPTHSEGPFAARELKAAVNSPELVAEHLRVTGGKLRTRFPPEPNGYLHIGHAKSMNLNFEGAFLALGKDPKSEAETIFRYDDTNPEKENDVYIKSQADNVAWLGWKPARVTHSSDYFEQLYACGVALIKKGKAYVDHQSKEEMEVCREIARARDGRNPNSPWRDRPAEESLREFAAMRAGRYEEGTATLRLRIDMTHSNPTMWDPVAFRIKYSPHPVTGDAWCIYPSYDFSHCIIDSLEHIDYSLCTLEFEVRRDIYYWVLEQLDLYRPYVWEFSRLNLTHTMMSKRRILKLVEEKKVRGWDDPRLSTIEGLRRRGYTAPAINAFCRDIGVSRNENTIPYSRLEHHVREHLDATAKRAFVVLHPLKLTLLDIPEGEVRWVEAPDFPRDKALGAHRIALSRTVYIEADDFRAADEKDYYGLAPGKVAGLRYAGYVKVVEVISDPATGAPVELKCAYDHERSAAAGKVKGNLHWVSPSVPGGKPATAEVRLYDHLFHTESPGSSGDWEAEINAASETVLKEVFIDESLAAAAASGALRALTTHFQFERLGFFVVDSDTDAAVNPPRIVFNQTVSLKEDSTAKKVRGGAGGH